MPVTVLIGVLQVSAECEGLIEENKRDYYSSFDRFDFDFLLFSFTGDSSPSVEVL